MTGSVPGEGHPVSVLEKRWIKAGTVLATTPSRPVPPHPVPTSLPEAQSCAEGLDSAGYHTLSASSSSPSTHSLQPLDLTVFILIEAHFLNLVL